MSAKPLDGVNVLDFCWVAVGPMTTKYLGEYGATVVRVESAKRPGTLRSAAPFRDGIAGINRSGYFASYNANKMGITVDMRHQRARELMLRLAGWAHIVTENFTPGTMEGWGLGFQELKSVNPGLVMFSASMMGRGGPMATAARIRPGPLVSGRPHQRHRLARPYPRQSLRRLHRLHRPQVRRCRYTRCP